MATSTPTPAQSVNPCAAILAQLNALRDKKADAMKDYRTYLDSYEFHQASYANDKRKLTATCQGHEFMVHEWDREINSQVQLAAIVCSTHSKF